MSLNQGVAGASSPGVMTEMIALGAMEAFLIKGATVTFFRFRYSRHTNFAMEPVFQNFNTQVRFGGDAQCTLARTADLLFHMYVVVELPGIQACSPQSSTCQYSSASANASDVFPSLLLQSFDSTCPINYETQCTVNDQLVWADPGAPLDQIEAGRNQWLFDQYGARQAPYQPEVFSVVDSAIAQGDQAAPFVHWHNAVGQKIIHQAALLIGSHLIDTLYADYLYMWEELSGKAGKRLKEMVGKASSRKQLIRNSQFDQRFWVPLPFFFTQHPGMVLPLVSLQFHGVQVNIQFAELRHLIVKSGTDVTPVKSSNFQPISDNDLKAVLDTTYIYLDMEERDRFATANFDQLITQVQVQTFEVTSQSVTVPLNLNHPVIELIWCAKRQCHVRNNNSFNYSGIDGRDPIEQVGLLLNNQPRWQQRPGQYFRQVQPYQHHSSRPKAHIYVFSFALFPEELQPTGACNFSRIDNASMVFKMQSGLEAEQVTIVIFARNRQLLRYIEGVGGQLFNA